MTVAFLEMWNAAGNVKSKELVPEKYVINHAYQAQQRGYVQPYADSPLDGEQVGEEVYISMANKADAHTNSMILLIWGKAKKSMKK